jgi:hypothetical protein
MSELSDRPTTIDMTDAPSFVADVGGTVSYWSVAEIGDMQTDIARGERMAEEAMRYALSNACPTLIAMALLHIAQGNRTGPVECGFMARIACAASAGSLN